MDEKLLRDEDQNELVFVFRGGILCALWRVVDFGLDKDRVEAQQDSAANEQTVGNVEIWPGVHEPGSVFPVEIDPVPDCIAVVAGHFGAMP